VSSDSSLTYGRLGQDWFNVSSIFKLSLLFGQADDEDSVRAASEAIGQDYPDHQRKAILYKEKRLALEKVPKKGTRLSQKFVASDNDESDNDEGTDDAKKPSKTTSSKVFVEDAQSWWFKYPLEHPNSHRVNHQWKIASDRAKEAAAGREEESGPELPKPTVAPKIASEAVAPRNIDSDEEKDPAMDLDQPEPAVTLASDLLETPEKKVEDAIVPPILHGVWKTDDTPPHLVKNRRDKLKAVYSAYNSALLRRALEADKLVTHAPTVQREKLKDPSKPEVDVIPIDIQRAAMYDFFGE
jgi:hypothetical protein